jgi:hypothetical protein
MTGWERFEKSVVLFFEPVPKTDTPEDLYQEIKDRWVPNSRWDHKKLVRWVEAYDSLGNVNPNRRVTLVIEYVSYASEVKVSMINTPKSFQGPSFFRVVVESKSRLSPPSLGSNGRGIPLSLEEKGVILEIIQSNFGFKYQVGDLSEETVRCTVQNMNSSEVWRGYRKPSFTNIDLIYDKDENPRMIRGYGFAW